MKRIMKHLLTLFTLFILSSFFGQINYNHLQQEWCRCLPDSSRIGTDTIRFMASPIDSTCETNRYSKMSIHNDNLHYTFSENDSMMVYRDAGNFPNPNYIPDTVTTYAVSFDTLYNIDSSEVTTTWDSIQVKIPLMHSWHGSAARSSISNYSLDKVKNKIRLNHEDFGTNEKRIYKVIQLTEKQMILILLKSKPIKHKKHQ